MDDEVVEHQQIVEYKVDGLMRDGDVIPRLFGVKQFEVKSLEQREGEECTTETETLTGVDNIAVEACGIVVWKIDLTVGVDRNSGYQSDPVGCRGLQPPKGIGLNQDVAFDDNQVRFFGQSSSAGILKGESIVGRWMVGMVCPVDEPEAVLMGQIGQESGVFRSAKVVVDSKINTAVGME